MSQHHDLLVVGIFRIGDTKRLVVVAGNNLSSLPAVQLEAVGGGVLERV